MSAQLTNEGDVVDALLGQASPEVMDRVRAATRSNPEVADLWEQWARALPALREERERANAMTERVRKCVMASLAKEGHAARVSVSHRRARSGAAAALKVAVCGVTLLVVLVGWPRQAMPPSEEPASERGISTDLPSDEVSYAAHAGERHHHPKDAWPTFSNLSDAIEAVPTGGVLVVQTGGVAASVLETPRLTKPMRIEAEGGPVRLGLFPNGVLARPDSAVYRKKEERVHCGDKTRETGYEEGERI